MTPGERKLAQRLLDCLDDNCLIWYEVAQRYARYTRYPDFIILHPRHGLLFAEVKDWKPDSLKALNPQDCVLLTQHGIKHRPHPLEQARQVALTSINSLQSNPALLQTNGAYRGNLLFPYDYGVLFTNITREQMAHIVSEDKLERLLPAHKTLFKEDLAPSVGDSAFQNRLMGIFEKRFPCRLERNHIDAIRWHIFPEVRVGDAPQLPLVAQDGQNLQGVAKNPQALNPGQALPDVLRVMDMAQEKLARSLGEGHRVIHGVAGSGKTLVLVHRCQILSQALNKPILVLCFNIVLANKLRSLIAAKNMAEDKVQVHHFHDWCSVQCKQFQIPVPPYQKNGHDAQVDAAVQAFKEGKIPRGQYGAVLIDEGHDFNPEWLELTTQLVDPAVNSLLLLYDDAQSIYQKRSALGFSLASVGIQAQGRTSILKINYRNPREITQFAWDFIKSTLSDDNAEFSRIAPQTAGASGAPPELRPFDSLNEEIAWLVHHLRT